MFAKLAVALSTFAVLATATPTGVPTSVSQCNTGGGAQCCNKLSKVSDPATSTLLGLLGVVVQDVTADVGLGCTPISVLGTGVDCSAHPVCCVGNNFNGLVNVGCSPISL